MCEWRERIPGGTRRHDGLETGSRDNAIGKVRGRARFHRDELALAAWQRAEARLHARAHLGCVGFSFKQAPFRSVAHRASDQCATSRSDARRQTCRLAWTRRHRIFVLRFDGLIRFEFRTHSILLQNMCVCCEILNGTYVSPKRMGNCARRAADKEAHDRVTRHLRRQRLTHENTPSWGGSQAPFPPAVTESLSSLGRL